MLCTFIMRLRYVLRLQTDFHSKVRGQNGSFDNKGCWPLLYSKARGGPVSPSEGWPRGGWHRGLTLQEKKKFNVHPSSRDEVWCILPKGVSSTQLTFTPSLHPVVSSTLTQTLRSPNCPRDKNIKKNILCWTPPTGLSKKYVFTSTTFNHLSSYPSYKTENTTLDSNWGSHYGAELAPHKTTG